MSAEEAEHSQLGREDGGDRGPGAPTPLSALEVNYEPHARTKKQTLRKVYRVSPDSRLETSSSLWMGASTPWKR